MLFTCLCDHLDCERNSNALQFEILTHKKTYSQNETSTIFHHICQLTFITTHADDVEGLLAGANTPCCCCHDAIPLYLIQTTQLGVDNNCTDYLEP